MDHYVYSILLTLCFTAVSVFVQGTDDPDKNVVISLPDGQQLKGLNTTSFDGEVIYKFYGIPYAVPPLGDRRFKPPVPASDWTGVKDAIKKSAICPQDTNEDLTSVRSEDCLYLNVFTPDVKGSLPVLLWIHGGGYRTGSAFNDGDGATLAPRGIVAVTINYRLGPFGFLSTGDDVMPGNYGMLDQVLTLKWVQKYIKSFGGDPNQVTIGGESAGAHSVSLHIVSPLSKGLFHRAILESGSAVSLPSVPANFKQLLLRSASRVGCDKTTSEEVLECLQKVDATQIIDATRDAPISPRVETIYGFLPDAPINLLKAGNYNRVDTLHGTNSGEFSGSILDPENDGVTRQEFENTVRASLQQHKTAADLSRLITDAYVGNETDPIILRKKLVNAQADLIFGTGTLIEENLYASEPGATTKHFLYEFDYRMSGTTSPVWQGVAHAAERRFVFYPDVRYNYTTADDRAVGEVVQTMWVNFIIYGDPTPSNSTQTTGSSPVKWSEFTKNSPNLLKIDVQSKLVPYPRLFLIPLFDKLSELIKSSEQTTVVG